MQSYDHYADGTVDSSSSFTRSFDNHGNLLINVQAIDFDGDGVSNNDEYIAGTSLTNPASVLRITNFTRTGDTGSVTFPTVAGRIYLFESSFDLVNWNGDSFGGVVGTGNPITLPFGGIEGEDRLFVRIRVSR